MNLFKNHKYTLDLNNEASYGGDIIRCEPLRHVTEITTHGEFKVGDKISEGEAFLVKSIHFEVLSMKLRICEIADAISFGLFKIAVSNCEKIIQFPGSEFINYLDRCYRPYAIKDALVLKESSTYEFSGSLPRGLRLFPLEGEKAAITIHGAKIVRK